MRPIPSTSTSLLAALRLCLPLAAVLAALAAWGAHGIAGNRYFPGTLTFGDPAVADELILPDFSSTRYPVISSDTVTDTTVAALFARLLTPDLAVGVDSSGSQWSRPGRQREGGLGTTSISPKSRFFEDDPAKNCCQPVDIV
jgi:hypothetical protein